MMGQQGTVSRAQMPWRVIKFAKKYFFGLKNLTEMNINDEQ